MNILGCIVDDVQKHIVDDVQEQVYQKYKATKSKPAFDVIGFAEELGLKVKESSELPDKVSGFIKKVKEEGICICVNSKHHPNRQRFTIAHELGHYFLHKDQLEEGIVDGVLKREDGVTNTQEKDANQFAADLLMPKDIFEQLWNDGDANVSAIALIFAVSESAVMTRAKSLKLMDEYNFI